MAGNFIIVASARKGTHLVTRALRKHPEVFCHNQIVNELEYQADEVDDYFGVQLDRTIVLPTIRLTGLEIRNLAWDAASYQSFWHELKHAEVGVIHLHRRNMVHWLVSVLMARQTDQWIADKPTETREKVVVACRSAELTIQQDWDEERLVRLIFRTNPIMHVWYENLATDFDGQMARILAFMKVSHLPLTPGCFKQQKRPLTEVIENYNQVAAEWEGTPFEAWLHEPPAPEVTPEVNA